MLIDVDIIEEEAAKEVKAFDGFDHIALDDKSLRVSASESKSLMKICVRLANGLLISIRGGGIVDANSIGEILVILWMLGYRTGYRSAEVAAVKAQVEGK